LPRPASTQLDFEREAQERPDQHDDGQHADARERRRDDDGSDDVASDQKLEPEEDSLTDPVPELPVRRSEGFGPDKPSDKAKRGDRDRRNDDRDAARIDGKPDRIGGRSDIHLRLRFLACASWSVGYAPAPAAAR
jgi:hypothetical protein